MKLAEEEAPKKQNMQDLTTSYQEGALAHLVNCSGRI